MKQSLPKKQRCRQTELEKIQMGRKKINNIFRSLSLFLEWREKISSAVIESWEPGINHHLVVKDEMALALQSCLVFNFF